ncbi:MAG TPA: IPT/TIG domain-containing protein, partial [Candidatus Polarisedimenticolia bacterium]|nr:IPT/TIG domain-containing protein [Candidatus Polarisedimenticolia bacterium]
MRQVARRRPRWTRVRAASLTAVLISALLGVGAARADASLGGEVRADLTLDAAGGPYLVTSDLIVRQGATLTLQPGVVVRLAAGVSLIVEDGALRVLGAPGARVLITSATDVAGGTPAPGDWGFLRFLGGANDALTRLDQVDLRYGQGVTIQAASPRLDATDIEFMAGPAIRIDLDSFPAGSGNSASHNGLNVVSVAPGEMTGSGAWTLTGIPYYLEGPVTIGRAPSISGVTPLTFEQDSATPASIAGRRLDGSTQVAFSGTGVTAQVLLGGTETALPVLISVDPAAPLGSRTFTVDAAAGLTPSGSIIINIVPGTPVVQSVTPALALAGAADTPITIGGRKFNADSQVRVDDSPVATTFVGPTQLTAVIPASRLLTAGTLALSVANPDPTRPGQFLVSGAIPFTVSPPPAVTLITPDHGARGSVVDAAIGGANLTGATSVVFSGGGLSAVVMPGGTAVNVPIRITIDAAAATGPRSFTVTTPLGVAASGATHFTVTVPQPVVGSISPTLGILGSGGTTLTINGAGFIPESVAQFNGLDRPTTVLGPTRLSAALGASDLSLLGSFPVRVVNPDAANPALSQTSNSVTFQVIQPSLSLSPSPLGVRALQSATLAVTLSIPAPSGGVSVTLTPFAPLVATVNGGGSATILIPEGQTQGTVSVQGVVLDGGATTITATAGGFLTALVTVNVTPAPRLNVTPPALLVGVSRSAQVTVTSSVIAPPGGIIAGLVQATPGIVSAPATVLIPEGTTSIQATIGGLAAGSTSLSAAAAGFATGTTCIVTVRAVAIVLPGSILVSPGLSRPFAVSLTDPAPAGGTTVNFTSSNGAAADPPASIVIPEGSISGSATITGKAAGTTTIGATDPSAFFQGGSMIVNVQAVNITVAPSSGSTFKGVAFGLRPSVFINAAAPVGGQVINLTSNNPGVATVPPSVTIPQGQTAAAFDVTGVGAGTAVITPSAAGLSTTGTFSVTVVDTRFDISRNIGSYGLRTLTGGRNGRIDVVLPGTAPAPVTVTVSVDDPTAALVAPYNAATAPSASLALVIPAGSNSAGFDLIGTGVRPFVDLSTPLGVALHPTTGDLFIADYGNDRVRRVDAATGVISTFAGTTRGFGGDGGPATGAQLGRPAALAFDSAGDLFIADGENNRIRRVDASTGVITTVAGNPAYSCGQPRDGRSATDAGLCSPRSLEFDDQGRLYIGDQSFHRVRRIVPGSDGFITGGSDETITTVAGDGSCAFAGDGGPATAASLCNPVGVRVDPRDGSLYIADLSNQRVRRVDGSTGIITTVAGNPSYSCSQVRDGQRATDAGLCNPAGLALGAGGALYVSERGWHRIRRVAPGSDGVVNGGSDDTITTVAGTGNCGFNGNGRTAQTADLCTPDGLIAVGDTLVFDDSANHQIRRVDLAGGSIGTLAGSGEAGLSGDGLVATGPQLIVSAPGFTTNSAPIAVLASSLQFSGLETSRNTLSSPNTFTLRIGTPEIGFGYRAAQPLTITLLSSNPGAVSVPSTVTFPDNATSSAGAVASVAGPGSATLTAQVSASTPPLGPIGGASGVVTVVPATLGVNSDPLSPNGDSRLTTGTGVRNGAYGVVISGPAPAGGVTVHLASSDP